MFLWVLGGTSMTLDRFIWRWAKTGRIVHVVDLRSLFPRTLCDTFITTDWDGSALAHKPAGRKVCRRCVKAMRQARQVWDEALETVES